MAFCSAFCPKASSFQTLQSAKRCKVQPVFKRARRRVRHVHGLTAVVNMAPTFLLRNVGQAVTLNGALFVVAKLLKQRVLTSKGLLHAFGLGVLLWSCLSWQGYILCFSFLILGSLLTKLGKKEKERLGIAEKRGGARGPENLWGAAGVAAICAVCALVCKVLMLGGMGMAVLRTIYKILLVGYTASLATKISDTTASEIGKAYGTLTYLVTNFMAVPRGTEGGVSFEGTFSGWFASLVAAYYSLRVGLLTGWWDVWIVVTAAFVATTAESYIGATLQKERKWTNEYVNFLNTAIGALLAMMLKCVFLLF